MISAFFGTQLLPGTLKSHLEAEESVENIVLTCPRHVVGVEAAILEFNKVYQCMHPVSSCQLFYGWGEKETKSCDGYNGDPWPWIGPHSNQFLVADQDNIIAAAFAWANSHKPNCPNGSPKTVISVTFFLDVITDDSETCVIGFKVQYGCCVKLPPPKKR